MAFQFTPPTYNIPYKREGKYNLWRWYDGPPVGYTVLIVSGVASELPGRVSPTTDELEAADSGSGWNGKAVFLGGRAGYTVTAGEKTILEAAGYTVVTV